MRKVIAAINMTINGNFDHREGIVDAELHRHYSELLTGADDILYGRKTYELMKYWKQVAENPTDKDTENEFAAVINKINKIVFSNSVKDLDWETAVLAEKSPETIVEELKAKTGRSILIGSRSLIIQLLKLNLIDEFQLCIHPILANNEMQLFENWEGRLFFELQNSKVFETGAVALYYRPKVVK